MELSFTRLRVYLECPWKYKLSCVDGKPIPPSPSGALGLSLHRAVERFHRAGAESLEDLLEAYDAEWLGSGYTDKQQAQVWRRKGERMLKRWLEQEHERRSEILGVEREFVYALGRHTVRGMIDRIDRAADGKIELIDYKTGEESAAPPAENLQLRFYALGAKQALRLAPDALTIHYLAAGRRESSPYDASREDELKTLIQKTADAIEREEFAADTRFCPRCAYRNDCRFSV